MFKLDDSILSCMSSAIENVSYTSNTEDYLNGKCDGCDGSCTGGCNVTCTGDCSGGCTGDCQTFD